MNLITPQQTRTITYTSIFLNLVLLLFVQQFACNKPSVVTKTEYIVKQNPRELIHDTTNNIKYRDRLKYVNDTIYRDGIPLPFTPFEYCDSVNQFTAQSDTILTKSGDTLQAMFRYPAKIFTIDFRPKPDTTIKITNTIFANEKKFGIFVGVGANVGIDGTIRAGLQIGVGISIF